MGESVWTEQEPKNKGIAKSRAGVRSGLNVDEEACQKGGGYRGNQDVGGESLEGF